MTASVLVIDDAVTVRAYHRQLLEGMGFQVEEAVNGLEGLEKAVQGSFDLFIVDVNMPTMDGYEFLTKARADDALKEVPALMISTESELQDVERAYDAGANTYLFKPVKTKQFQEAVKLLAGAGI